MKIISSTTMRKDIAEIINQVSYTGQIFGVERRNKVEAIIMKYPSHKNTDLSEISNVNANSKSFSFLEDEPDLYTREDLKQNYV